VGLAGTYLALRNHLPLSWRNSGLDHSMARNGCPQILLGKLEQRKRKVLVVLVLPVNADRFEIARKRAQQHDESCDHQCARVVCSQDHDATRTRSVSWVKATLVESLEQVWRIKLSRRVILATQQVYLA
jgi:hypothetical protein